VLDAKAGAYADLLLTDGNPLQDFSTKGVFSLTFGRPVSDKLKEMPRH
jgi:hypothetical protein